MSKYEINILHIYPDLLNLYGDSGNIAALTKRLTWRNIDVSVTKCLEDDKIPDLDIFDIIFLGGGSDREQETVCKRLCDRKEDFKKYVENDGVLLATCGGFPMLGNYYLNSTTKVDGLGILDIYTDLSTKRLISDVILDSELISHPIVGFANHATCTHIRDYTPLGRVAHGYGNTSESNFEGVIYKNVIGTYLHGPLLPKNPQLCDYILTCALKKKYSEFTELTSINDELEYKANEYMINRFKNEKA